MIKKFCDVCCMEIIGFCHKLACVEEQKGELWKLDMDLCHKCRKEVGLFIEEQCKLHMLSKVDDAIKSLEV
jgi:hypothetical protein